MKLEIHSAARLELRDAARYYEQRVVGLGVDFRHAVQEALDNIVSGRTSGAVAEGFDFESGFRRVNTRRFPYSIIYNETTVPRTVYVLAIMHHNREPNYWASRQDDI